MSPLKFQVYGPGKHCDRGRNFYTAQGLLVHTLGSSFTSCLMGNFIFKLSRVDQFCLQIIAVQSLVVQRSTQSHCLHVINSIDIPPLFFYYKLFRYFYSNILFYGGLLIVKEEITFKKYFKSATSEQ